MKLKAALCLALIAVVPPPANADEVVQLQPLQNAAAPCGDCLDVLGISLGSPCSSLPTLEGYTVRRESGVLSANGFSSAAYPTTIHIDSKVGPDRVWVRCSTPLTGGLVSSIERQIEYPKLDKAPLASALIADLAKKYGPPSAAFTDGGVTFFQVALNTEHKPLASLVRAIGIRLYEPDTPKYVKDGISQSVSYAMESCGNNRQQVCLVQNTSYFYSLLEQDNIAKQDFIKNLQGRSTTMKEGVSAGASPPL